jgi:hypothetical protein
LYVFHLCIFLYLICFLVSSIVKDENNRSSHICIDGTKKIKESFSRINITIGGFYLGNGNMSKRIIGSRDIESCSSCI